MSGSGGTAGTAGGARDADDAGARERRARLVVSAFYLVQGMCFAGLLAQVPTLQHDLGISDGTLTLILLLVPVVAGVGSVLAGALAPRVGSDRLLHVCGPLVALAVLGAGLAPTVGVLYPVVAAVGLLLGLVDASMNMQGVEVEQRYGRSLLNSFHGAWSVGGILGSLAAVLAHSLGWSLAAGLGLVAAVGVTVDLVATAASGRGAPRPTEREAVPGLVTAAGPLRIVNDVPEPGRPAGREQDDAGASRPQRPPWGPLLLVGLAVTIVYVADSATSNWSTKYIQDALGAAANVAPLGLAAYLGCQLLGRLAADRQVNRFGPVVPVAVGGIVGAAGLAAVTLAPGPWVAVVGFGLTGLGLSVVVPLAFSVAGRLDPEGTGVAVARVNLFNYVGFVVGAGLIGAVAELTSLRLAFAVPALLALGVIALAPAFRVAARDASVAAPAPETR
ncbi:MFS transporter [Krasilnikoviella flava]|uniref:Sugar phosphate permease n=1 Tax=Krasilnikoviella flava TaxID=526729 RepID=A0A1T5KCX0_9MICO|nr:MFS transporter [Krasilnikoviella flava]SKC61228.1 Sugar phosphate permease [Krasilnikoviella flava]